MTVYTIDTKDVQVLYLTDGSTCSPPINTGESGIILVGIGLDLEGRITNFLLLSSLVASNFIMCVPDESD